MAGTTKKYQVWALLRGQDGIERWTAITRKYSTRRAAVNVAASLWLQTRIEESEEDPDD
jgi:hypothetical protein